MPKLFDKNISNDQNPPIEMNQEEFSEMTKYQLKRWEGRNFRVLSNITNTNFNPGDEDPGYEHYRIEDGEKRRGFFPEPDSESPSPR